MGSPCLHPQGRGWESKVPTPLLTYLGSSHQDGRDGQSHGPEHTQRCPRSGSSMVTLNGENSLNSGLDKPRTLPPLSNGRWGARFPSKQPGTACVLPAIWLWLGDPDTHAAAQTYLGSTHQVGSGRQSLGWFEVKSQLLHLDLPRGCRNPSMWAICCCFPKYISVELDQKCSSQDSKQHLYEMLTPQVELRLLCHRTGPISPIVRKSFSFIYVKLRSGYMWHYPI